MIYPPAALSRRQTMIPDPRSGYVYSRPTVPTILSPGPLFAATPYDTFGDVAVSAANGLGGGLGMAVNIRDALRRNAALLGIAVGGLVFAGVALFVVWKKTKKRKRNRRKARRRLARPDPKERKRAGGAPKPEWNEDLIRALDDYFPYGYPKGGPRQCDIAAALLDAPFGAHRRFMALESAGGLRSRKARDVLYDVVGVGMPVLRRATVDRALELEALHCTPIPRGQEAQQGAWEALGGFSRQANGRKFGTSTGRGVAAAAREAWARLGGLPRLLRIVRQPHHRDDPTDDYIGYLADGEGRATQVAGAARDERGVWVAAPLRFNAAPEDRERINKQPGLRATGSSPGKAIMALLDKYEIPYRRR